MGQKMADRPTVFVVDNDQAIRKGVAALAEREGLVSETFASAEAFLSACEPSRLGCLVADVRLFGPTGAEFQAELDKHQIILPVIAIATDASVKLAIQVMRAEALTLLEKPYLDEDLRHNIRRALDIDAKSRS